MTFSGKWQTANSSCGGETPSKVVLSDGQTTSQFGTASYSFHGSAVFLKMSAINADYAIILDGATTEYGGLGRIGDAALPPNCTFGWWRDNLDSTLHDIRITVYGTGNATNKIKQPWTVEFHSLVITRSGASSSTSRGASPTTSGPAGDKPSTADGLKDANKHLVFLALVLLAVVHT
ncbi:hypothetical protein MIND_00465100 [Mycena indigotica]|uniref:Uncharacterized protein n=1 Tax=Mycena indigotica TaxID=2126181 RepID=A0A8H6W5N9_9AGAR|nr:uncharacterized protein MIND_00465100 [Mycena indigotica]KAF7306734.1 hypothetical protein MIND_00465100 [Mycena indigotica]